MPPLPFNLGIDKLLRRGITAALFTAPLLLLLASLVPFILLDDWATAAVGLPAGASFRVHEHGELIESLVGLAGLGFAAVGYLSGWAVNALCLRVLAWWPWPDVQALMLRSQVPRSWLRNWAPSEHERAEMREELDYWATKRSMGAGRFILQEGAFKLGAAFFAVLVIVRVWKQDPVLVAKSWPGLMLGALMLGLMLGAMQWFWREHRHLYRRQLLAED
jgi:hypothetical protein